MFNDHQWFTAAFTFPGFDISGATDAMPAAYVRDALLAADSLRPGFFQPEKGYQLTFNLEFDTRWGLGSSSSLLSNLAWWMDVDPYRLLWKISSASGYDIACARADGPLIYQRAEGIPVVTYVDFNPPFTDSLFFVYLGKKQDSRQAVTDSLHKAVPSEIWIDEVSALTEEICRADNVEEFSGLITRHEECISGFLGEPPVKSARFPGFPGAVKSLGAWGGDMVLVVWEDEEEDLRKYFDSRGLKLIFRYSDLI